jgi:hypothetical protein
MKRLLPPDKAVLETGVPRANGGETVYRQHRDGTIHVADADVRALKQAGYTTPSAGGFARSHGWRCDDCGFHGYFRLCGRCKGENTRRGDAVT